MGAALLIMLLDTLTFAIHLLLVLAPRMHVMYSLDCEAPENQNIDYDESFINVFVTRS